MNATRILWGQVIAVISVTLLGIWSATQWTAHALAHQPELGEPWFWLGPWPIYPPYAFFWWWFAFDAYAPQIFQTGAFIAVSGAMAAIVIAIAMSVWRAREEKQSETYGSARWATDKEIKQGWPPETGRRGDRLAQEPVSAAQWPRAYSLLCADPFRQRRWSRHPVAARLAGQLHRPRYQGRELGSDGGLSRRHGRVLLFDPTNPASNPYNPLLEVRKGDWEVRDAQNIADILIDPEGSLEKRTHWEKTSHSLLVGTILHVLYAEKDKSLAGVAGFLSDPRRSIETTLHRMKTTPHLGKDGVHPVVAAAAQELLNKSDNERSGVLSTAMSFLGLYRDPVIAQVTGASDWRITDLVDSAAPVSLYLVIPPSDISRTKPLVRLMLNQIGRRLTEELRAKGRRQRVMFMLDEFPALGRLDFFESALAFVAGYGIKAFLIAQSLNQIEKAYGSNNAILDNCHVRVAFAANDDNTASRVSNALGTATQMRAMKNYAGHRLSPWLGHIMVSRTETPRPLLTPGEVQQFSEHEEIVLVASTPPIRAEKAKYFLDPRFPRAPSTGTHPQTAAPEKTAKGRLVCARTHCGTAAD
jgi:type IV secretion system protein VirD4